MGRSAAKPHRPSLCRRKCFDDFRIDFSLQYLDKPAFARYLFFALYQGTTLLVPSGPQNKSGLSP
jgi:hypothetical protein